MKIYAYIMTHDYGFAPNPYHGFLTLATCKPQIRRSKNLHLGDWIIGISSKHNLGRDRLLYAAKIDEIVPLKNYSTNGKFDVKKPGKTKIDKCGDNIYYLDINKNWQQMPNGYHGGNEQERDLSGENVLIANEFWYFGEKAPVISSDLQKIISNARLKCLYDEALINDFIVWINTFPKGLNGNPSMSVDSGGCSSSCGKSSFKVEC